MIKSDMVRDGNGTGFFRYSPHPAPNGMGFNFNKRVSDGYEIFFLNPESPRPAQIIYKIKLNLNFKINFI